MEISNPFFTGLTITSILVLLCQPHAAWLLLYIWATAGFGYFWLLYDRKIGKKAKK